MCSAVAGVSSAESVGGATLGVACMRLSVRVPASCRVTQFAYRDGSEECSCIEYCRRARKGTWACALSCEMWKVHVVVRLCR